MDHPFHCPPPPVSAPHVGPGPAASTRRSRNPDSRSARARTHGGCGKCPVRLKAQAASSAESGSAQTFSQKSHCEVAVWSSAYGIPTLTEMLHISKTMCAPSTPLVKRGHVRRGCAAVQFCGCLPGGPGR